MNPFQLDAPLFIIGNPRSGTTLLRLILTSHSRVLIPPECGLIIWLHRKYSDWDELDYNDSTRLHAFLDDLFASRKFDTWLLDREDVKKRIIAIRPTSYAELCGVVYAAFGARAGKDSTVWGDKNNFHTHHLNELLNLYPRASFLHIVRDGRDVACSYREVMEAKPTSPYAPHLNTGALEIALEWSSNVTKVDSFMSSLPRKRAMTVRYEDLVRDALSSVKLMCGWLGLQFEDEMVTFYQQNISKELEPELTLPWKLRTMQPISDDTVGRYEDVLSAADKGVFLVAAGDVLRRFSYL